MRDIVRFRKKRINCVRFTFILSEDLAFRLDEVAECRQVNRSILIRQACDRMLRDFESKKEVAA